MNARIQKTLIAGFVAALVSAPGWAAGTGADTGKTGAESTTERSTSTEIGTQTPTTTAASGDLQSLTADQLNSMEVVGANGEHIGDVDAVVLGENKVHVVVGAGGFLGMGERNVAIPLDQLELSGEQLVYRTTKEQLMGQPEYDENRYSEVEPSDKPVSDFAAFEPSGDKAHPAATGGGKDQWQKPGAAGDSGEMKK